jgi:hypothetical protein
MCFKKMSADWINSIVRLMSLISPVADRKKRASL